MPNEEMEISCDAGDEVPSKPMHHTRQERAASGGVAGQDAGGISYGTSLERG